MWVVGVRFADLCATGMHGEEGRERRNEVGEVLAQSTRGWSLKRPYIELKRTAMLQPLLSTC